MIAFQPDPSFQSGAVPQPEARAGVGAGPATYRRSGTGAALDFAGLVNAALPGGKVNAVIGAERAANVGAIAPSLPAAVLPAPNPALNPIAPPTLVRELPQAPGGTILPERGAVLPPETAAVPTAAVPPPPALALASGQVRAGSAAAAPVSLLNDDADADASADADADAGVGVGVGSEAEAADQAVAVPVPDAGALATLALANAPAPVTPSAAAAAVAAATLSPAPALVRPPAQGARQGGVEARSGAVQAGATPVRAEHAALPARAVLGDFKPNPAAETPDPELSPSAPAPAPALAAAAATAAQADVAPAWAASAPLTPTPAIDRNEPRAPAPQQEATIAAVSELREALRAARPELTLRHAEFGPVSLRIEQVAGQDWRAVLASRDPGFVPAIQAALTERAVAAAADTASANTTGNPGQNGTSDQRYGASPNGGQGSSQPYLAQSSNRDDGGQHQGQQPSQQRQPHTTDSVAARADEGDAARADPRDRGVFA